MKEKHIAWLVTIVVLSFLTYIAAPIAILIAMVIWALWPLLGED